MKGTLINTKHMRQPSDDRGTGRTEAFSDGVIAVAITLLILDVHVPDVQTGLLPALLHQWPTYLGYVTSFLVITIFWANHHDMFRHIQQVDYALLIINAFFLMCIAFIPFATALLTRYITSPTNQHTAAIVYGATLLLNGILFNSIWWYAVGKRRLVLRDLDTQAVQRITRGYLFGLPFYALAIVLSLLNVELSLAFYILIDLMYVLPIPFLRFGRPDIFSVGAQEAPEGHLPHTHAKNELPEVAREPE
jgi:TMEM175 potassium channel family protein